MLDPDLRTILSDLFVLAVAGILYFLFVLGGLPIVLAMFPPAATIKVESVSRGAILTLASISFCTELA